MTATSPATLPGGLLTDPRVFDVTGALPTGTTVLEASAGTGKTFTIAALTTRYVAEGVADLSRLLLVTFGRAATSELRDRVRERLVSAERALRGEAPRASTDPLVAYLAAVDDAELDRRRDRLTAALAQFDAATIATTHGFCQQMLTSLGLAADVDADAALVPDLADLVDEVVDDLYLRRYADDPTPDLTVADARAVARAAAGSPQARLEPAAAAPPTLAGQRFAFARAVVAEMTARKRARRVLDYDDLLVLLRDALADRVHGPAAAQRVRSRYAVVLVDEFQDTDPVQWEILSTAFHGHCTLVLIGDPKQAIYAFRGGDVVAYLAARGAADHAATLSRSWRSDAPLLAGLDHLLGGAALGDPRIRVLPVEAQHAGRRYQGGAPVRLRHLTRPALGVSPRSTPPVAAVRSAVAVDVAADIVRQLETGRLLDGGTWRPVRPADVAVLTRRNADAVTVRDALAAAGVPAVVSGLSSVFDSPAARAWLTLLVALEQPGHSGRTAAAALTPFVGWDAARLGTASEAERDDLSDRVRRWAALLTGRGVAALFETAAADGLAERLLRTTTGERTLTDLRHVAQTLHLAATADGLGVAALADWLRRRIAEAGQDYAEERSRRLETDAAAVQVVTVHASKGLEFPVVYVPFAWDRFESGEPPILRHHDADGARVLDVGGASGPGYDTARSLHMAEERGEDLRLLYVALTRACSQVVLWWAPSRNTGGGPLTRVVLGRPGPGEDPPARVSVTRDEQAQAAFESLAAASGGAVAAEQVDEPPTTTRWAAPAGAPRALDVAGFDRHLDVTWRRTSYTGITADAHARQYAVEEALAAEAGGATAVAASAGPSGGFGGAAAGGPDASRPGRGGLGGEPERTGTDDEPPALGRSTGEVGAAADQAREVPLPMADLPSGAAFGTLVHAVLERVDTEAADLDAEVRRRCYEAGAARFGGVDPARLAAGLGRVLATPLGPAAGGVALRDVPPSDRLAELEFELPLAGGDTPTGPGATVGAIGDLLHQHLDAPDPFRPYADRLATASFAPTRLRGYLTGSLDAVLRLRDDGGDRFVVVDYKTNRLAPPGVPLTAAHYRRDALVAAMTEADYPLQLLLYLVALHRFLRWRLPGYDPGSQLGGGLYLFVRGMTGPDVPTEHGEPAGVMAWRPPVALVVALSELLDSGEPR